MKTCPSKHTKTHSQNPNKRHDHEQSEESLEKIAEELTALALKRLPDGVLRGILTAQEEDIRQQAILLALTWYLQGDRIDPDKPVEPWHTPRAIAGALRIIKRDTINELLCEVEGRERVPAMPTITRHPVMVRACNWPMPVKRELCQEAIRVALRDRKISALSAAVAEAVYVHGIHVSDLAKRRKVHRSSIYQQLSRAQPHLREIIETIEVALVNVM